MNGIERIILVSTYISQITKVPVSEIVKKKAEIHDIDTLIDMLIQKKLVQKNRKTLTAKGRNSLKVVLAGGVFDIIHPGHIHTLNAAKSLGDILVVVVATDNTAIKMKKRSPLHDQDQRQELVNSLVMVDLCLIGEEGNIFRTVSKVKPQIIALGYDQTHQEKFITEGCKKIKLNAQVARLESPIPDSSSSKIQKAYGKAIHGI